MFYNWKLWLLRICLLLVFLGVGFGSGNWWLAMAAVTACIAINP